MQCVVIPFHQRASAGAKRSACNEAKDSSVIPATPRVSAMPTIPRQYRCGIEPRARQELTVEALLPSAAATAPVLPKATTISSTERIIGPHIVRNLRTSQEFATREMLSGGVSGEIQDMPESLKIMANRLVLTRKALGYEQQTDFCEEFHVDKNVYNPFEKGHRRVSLDVALKIADRFDVGLDWIYRAKPSALPDGLYLKIVSLQKRAA